MPNFFDYVNALRSRSSLMDDSVMSQPSEPQWQPAYARQEEGLEQVSPEDFIPNPKALIAALKGTPTLIGMMGSRFFKPQSASDIAQSFANRFKNPVHLADNGRLSGFTDPIKQTTLHGYDKNGVPFTIAKNRLLKEELISSRDSNRTRDSLLLDLANK